MNNSDDFQAARPWLLRYAQELPHETIEPPEGSRHLEVKMALPDTRCTKVLAETTDDE